MTAPRLPLSAYKTIGEVSEALDLPQHVLRFWETRFEEIAPLRRGTGPRARRLYHHDDIALLNGIRFLMHGQGYSLRGVQRLLREHGTQYVREAIPSH